jgi:cytochrome d ubiquinol oxidase subunit II
MTPFLPPETLALVFASLMAISILAYVVLDGYDLGVGLLLQATPEEPERDRMVASIGPFWDANETWLVLGVGLLLVAFPVAHGMVLTALYMPVALLLVGLTLRGVAFEFRAKAATPVHKQRWDLAFAGGSALAALTRAGCSAATCWASPRAGVRCCSPRWRPSAWRRPMPSSAPAG